jgi:thiol-disulfide isomerase/thioredoxin
MDSNGQHAAGIEIASFWLGGVDDRSGLRAYGGAKSDNQGAFTFTTKEARFPMTFLAMDSERRLGAIATIADEVASRQRVVIRLQPLHPVRYRFQAVGLTDLSQNRIVLQPRFGGMFCQISGRPEGTISLPPGAYSFEISVAGGSQREVQFEVADRDVTLEPIVLSAGIAEHYGHPAPSLSDVEVVSGTSFDTETLRNKWVLVYFWGYWCAPCVNEGLPKLSRFYRKNQERVAHFEILAVHENGVAGNITANQLRQRLLRLAKQNWSGEALPFPILLDRSGETIKRWGVVAFPTVALINPKGDLVEGDLDTLRQVLDQKID